MKAAEPTVKSIMKAPIPAEPTVKSMSHKITKAAEPTVISTKAPIPVEPTVKSKKAPDPVPAEPTVKSTSHKTTKAAEPTVKSKKAPIPAEPTVKSMLHKTMIMNIMKTQRQEKVKKAHDGSFIDLDNYVCGNADQESNSWIPELGLY